MAGVLFRPDGLRLDGRMAPPLDEGGRLPCPVPKQGVPLSRKVGHDVVMSRVVGTDNDAAEYGGVQGREAERDERMEGHRRRRSRVGECSIYGRCVCAILGGVVLGGKGIRAVYHALRGRERWTVGRPSRHGLHLHIWVDILEAMLMFDFLVML